MRRVSQAVAHRREVRGQRCVLHIELLPRLLRDSDTDSIGNGTKVSAYDNWLAGYRRHTMEVWCSNRSCDNHESVTVVTFESEYGQGWFTPEECVCGGDWLEDQPEQEDEEE